MNVFEFLCVWEKPLQEEEYLRVETSQCTVTNCGKSHKIS